VNIPLTATTSASTCAAGNAATRSRWTKRNSAATHVVMFGTGILPTIDFRDYCPHCGRRLALEHDLRRVFCTIECTRAAYRALVSRSLAEARSGKNCQHCGSKFDAPYIDRQIFCSRACARNYHNAQTAKRSAAIRAVQRCQICGGPIVAKRIARFCSDRCARGLGINRPCAQCGVEFRQPRRGAICCSRRCGMAWARRSRHPRTFP
jgi:hypothetical protein